MEIKNKIKEAAESIADNFEDFEAIYKEMNANRKKVIYIDMDGVLVDFQSGIDSLSNKEKEEYEGRLDEVPDIFSKMKPLDGAIDAFNLLYERFDVYILSTAPWENPTALPDKMTWIKKYLPVMYKKVIFSHNKHLNNGEYLIDDRLKNGSEKFGGTLIQFGTEKYKDWNVVLKYFEEVFIKMEDRKNRILAEVEEERELLEESNRKAHEEIEAD